MKPRQRGVVAVLVTVPRATHMLRLSHPHVIDQSVGRLRPRQANHANFYVGVPDVNAALAKA